MLLALISFIDIICQSPWLCLILGEVVRNPVLASARGPITVACSHQIISGNMGGYRLKYQRSTWLNY